MKIQVELANETSFVYYRKSYVCVHVCVGHKCEYRMYVYQRIHK